MKDNADPMEGIRDQWRAFAASIVMHAPVPARFFIYEDAHVLKIQVFVAARDRDSGEARDLVTEHTIVDGDWNRRRTIVLDIVEKLYLHEIREQLIFDGVRTFDPHVDPCVAKP